MSCVNMEQSNILKVKNFRHYNKRNIDQHHSVPNTPATKSVPRKIRKKCPLRLQNVHSDEICCKNSPKKKVNHNHHNHYNSDNHLHLCSNYNRRTRSFVQNNKLVFNSIGIKLHEQQWQCITTKSQQKSITLQRKPKQKRQQRAQSNRDIVIIKPTNYTEENNNKLTRNISKFEEKVMKRMMNTTIKPLMNEINDLKNEIKALHSINSNLCNLLIKNSNNYLNPNQHFMTKQQPTKHSKYPKNLSPPKRRISSNISNLKKQRTFTEDILSLDEMTNVCNDITVDNNYIKQPTDLDYHPMNNHNNNNNNIDNNSDNGYSYGYDYDYDYDCNLNYNYLRVQNQFKRNSIKNIEPQSTTTLKTVPFNFESQEFDTTIDQYSNYSDITDEKSNLTNHSQF